MASAAVAATACAKAKQTPPATPPMKALGSADVRQILKNEFPKISGTMIDELTDIAGFNDQQPLSGDNADDTGPVASLYMVPARYDDAQFTDTWKLSAILELDPSNAMPQAYKNLKIKDNPAKAQYCIFLMMRTAGSKWIASITTVTSFRCGNANAGDKINDVARETEPGTTKGDFPAVVRFDQDKNGKALIGVPCGQIGWCEIGRPEGGANRRDPVHAALGAAQTNRHKVKAAHDEQEVTTDKAPPYKRAVRASVTPDMNLGDYTIFDFADPNGVAVAYVYLDAAPKAGTKYDTWGLMQGNNTVRLFAQAKSDASGYDWWATFTPDAGGGNGVRFLVKQESHHLKPPAVTRWAWNPIDEDIWMSCEQGCCTVSGNPTLVAIAAHLPLKP